MPSFADSFWTPDFSTGIEVLFNKLNQGCVENQEFIDLFTARMEYEEEYGKKLLYLPENHTPSKSGFDRDDGASLKNAFKGVTFEMGEEGKHHLNIANNIRVLVIEPFTKWSQEHKQRIQYSDQILRNSLKVYKNKARVLTKVQKKYFNKCRTLESMKEGMSESDLLKELDLDANTNEDRDETIVTLGGIEYGKSALRELFTKMLTEIPRVPLKVPIMGVYDNVSTGSSIVSWLQENLGISKIDQCESFGKDMIDNGYLKKINTTVVPGGGSNFVSSGSFHYQWRPSVFTITRISPNPTSLNDNHPDIDNDDYDEEKDRITTKTVSNYIDGLKSTFEEPSLKKIYKEVNELDESYKREVKKLDKIRCDLEELIVDHLSFMEKCELDRLRALKKVILDFSASISNNITILKSTIDKILVYEESIQPEKDLLFLLQNYKTGSFQPKVTLYDNYYDSSQKQIFGVDLETRCKNDNKNVPIIISSILSYMDSIYPNLQDDEIRTKIWLIPVRLQSTHALRRAIEDIGSADGLNNDFYSKYDPEIVTSVLKLYLLELPDSLVSNQLYDLIKSIYQQFGKDSETNHRINGVINVLKDLDKSNLSTLNAICTHFQRLISIVEKSDLKLSASFHLDISQEFSNCILRSRYSNNVNFDDKHSFKFLFDLLKYKSQIFKSLKDLNSLKKTSSINVKRANSSLKVRLEQAVKQNSNAPHNSIRKASNTPSIAEAPEEQIIVDHAAEPNDSVEIVEDS